ncbi:serine/threonine-protein kinase [Alienimonas chondri]|uniref:Serine/threonine-protein kinase PknD n=1 Tax=Alienimonas chondri TaxID=2681879 RepID=A0ABX1VHD3_9PLAN|nr:serine/threonine-protein kinase [Alienimonas chondri]NNJ27538.1 Serine/threonine-protein kinase PknD [Alienimonas chondri]
MADADAATPPEEAGDSPGRPDSPPPAPQTTAGSKAKTAGSRARTHADRSSAVGKLAAVAAGRSLGRFQIKGVVGHGGMGTIYRAFDPTLDRYVALKVPRFDAAGDPALRQQFLKEARAAAAVSHPHLVEVYEAGTITEEDGSGERCYIATELCEGPDLAKWLEQRTEPVPPTTAAALLIPMAEAVHQCHAVGVVHRDLKPANVLLDAPDPRPTESGGGDAALPFVPKVSDFGVARVLEESAAATRTSQAVGTPLYMSPEQAGERLEEIGPATDVWALGAILYETLTGRPPFDAGTTLGLLKQIDGDDPPPPRALRPGLPAGLDAICMKCLRKRPDERYASAADLAADLTAWQEGRAVSARRFCWRDRFATWSRRPARIRDAAMLAIVWNAALASGIALMAMDIGFGWETPLPEYDEFLGEAMKITIAHYAIALIAWRMLLGARWAYWICFASAVVCEYIVVNGLFFGGGGGFSMYRDLPVAKYLVLVTLTTAFTAQLTLFLLSLRARSVR